MFLSTPVFIMQLPAKKPPLFKRQIPTLLGLGILIVSLVAGLLMFGSGTGVFAPRATPQTTPKNVKVTNLTDKSFTVSFYTDEATSGFVKFGTTADSLKTQASDDRDQLSGTVGEFRLHHVTVRGLTPNTTYFYTLGTGSSARFDNNGAPFTIKTFSAISGTPSLNKTVYGTVANRNGAPAEGSIVFLLSDNTAEMSTLVKSSGSWAISLSSALASDGTGYAQLAEDSNLSVIVQGIEPSESSVFSTSVSNAQPAPEVTLGETPEVGLLPGGEAAEGPIEEEFVEPANEIDQDLLNNGPATSGSLDELIAEATDEEETTDEEPVVQEAVLDLTVVAETETPTLVDQPVIKGSAAPGVVVTIEVHSEAVITQTLVADENGGFTLDVAQLSQQLEPGEHTVTYSYTDPNSGEVVTRTQTFMVADTSNQIAQANIGNSNGSSSFGSGNPFPVETPTPTPTPTPEPEEETTRSAVVATDSGTFTAGSVTNTIALIVGGIFFIGAGSWSWWLAQEMRED